MASKRKKNPNQPELPIEALPDNTPGVVNAAPLPKGGNGEAPNPKSAKDGNGATHVLAENVAVPPPTRPFVPGKIELPLHRRVDRVLQNGRYVAPSLRPGDFAAIQRVILAALEIACRT